MTKQNFATLAVHAGDALDPTTKAVDEPIVLSNAFAFTNAEEAAAIFREDEPGWVYGRWASPNARTLERKVSALEGSESAVALSSGMGAVFGAITACVEAGSHIIAPNGLYAETGRILRTLLQKFGVETDFVDLRKIDAVQSALRPETSLIWVETPANPTLSIYDIEALANLARSHKARCVVDNTFATPFHQTPLSHGAHAVVHAATKALGGHGDAIAGVVCSDEEFCQRVREEAVRGAGASLAPFNAWLIARGLRTLALRASQSSQSSLALAQRLEAHPKVTRVLYPGLASHPEHAVAVRQMRRGFGSLVHHPLSSCCCGLPSKLFEHRIDDRSFFGWYEAVAHAPQSS